MTATVGIITGIQAEADLLQATARRLRLGPPLIAVAGLGEGRAARAAGDLIAQHATHLLSFGIAGGLDPMASAGTIVVASDIRGPKTLACDRGWTERLAELFGIGFAALAHAPDVLTTTTAKAALFANTRAVAADMESYGVAEVATARRIPFAAVRVIADTAAECVPSVAMRAMSPEGRIRPLAAVLGALTYPAQIPDLIRLGRQTAVAMRGLAISARLGAPLGFLAHLRDQ